jgi:hypothetical protein
MSQKSLPPKPAKPLKNDWLAWFCVARGDDHTLDIGTDLRTHCIGERMQNIR